MREETVEIYSDASNYAIMRHPGRNYPGTLIQGDSLSILCNLADDARQKFDKGDLEETVAVLDEVREMLWGRLQHYKEVMAEHGEEVKWGGNGPNPPIAPDVEEDAS